MNYLHLKILVEGKKLDVGGLWKGNPSVPNEIFMSLAEKHKMGHFESINKLIRRSVLEREDTLEVLWGYNLVVFKNPINGVEYRSNQIGTIQDLYKKIAEIE